MRHRGLLVRLQENRRFLICRRGIAAGRSATTPGADLFGTGDGFCISCTQHGRAAEIFNSLIENIEKLCYLELKYFV
jgi:hypothetical protein